MDRRQLLTLLGSTALTGMPIESAVGQQMTDPALVSPGRARRQTGRVDLIISGKRANALKKGSDILQTAKATKFFENGRYKLEFKGGSVEYVSAIFSQHAIAEAIIQGLLVHKFTITDTPPPQWRSFFSTGTFYFYVDFVEGPEFDEGRFIARIVDEAGNVRHILLGVEVRQVIDLHVDEQQYQEHSKPSFHTHGLAFGNEEKQLTGNGDSEDVFLAWSMTTGGWAKLGNGCSRVVVCNPPM